MAAAATAGGSIHVFGAAGLLGRELMDVFRVAGYRVTGTLHAQCDIANYLRVREVLSALPRPLVVLNAAGFTDVDAAERMPQAAFEANTIGPHNLALCCRELDAVLVHVSTDFVFDGEKGAPYDEFDAPNPLSVYARSKWQGEELVRRTWHRVFVLRTSCLYGHGSPNFASTVIAKARASEPLRVDGERTTSPTWTRSLAEQIRVLVETPFYGTYHASARGAATWSQFAQEVLRLVGLPNPINPVPTASLEQTARRPRHPILANHLLGLRGLDRMPEWRTALSRFMTEEILP